MEMGHTAVTKKFESAGHLVLFTTCAYFTVFMLHTKTLFVIRMKFICSLRLKDKLHAISQADFMKRLFMLLVGLQIHPSCKLPYLIYPHFFCYISCACIFTRIKH